MLNWIVEDFHISINWTYLLTQIVEHLSLLTQHLILILTGVYIYWGGRTQNTACFELWQFWFLCQVINIFGDYNSNKSYQLATNRFKKKKKKKGKMWSIFEQIINQLMNYSVSS